VTLDDDRRYLDLELTIQGKARDNWPEADWLCLPFKIRHPQFRVGRTLGVMDPAKDILPGANRHMYAVGAGVAITDADGAGVAVCPLDHPLVSLDRPGCWKFSLDFVPKKPVVFLNLYNNQWNTNYRYWYSGTWSSRVRLWTFDNKATRGAALLIPAMEARLPLLAALAEGPAGRLPATQKGLEVSRKGILVTAFSPKLVRVWEQAGMGGEVVLTGLRAANAIPVNLRGEKTGRPIPVSAGKLTFNVGPFAPASFALETLP
jgi:alpha-mannosidase